MNFRRRHRRRFNTSSQVKWHTLKHERDVMGMQFARVVFSEPQ